MISSQSSIREINLLQASVGVMKFFLFICLISFFLIHHGLALIVIRNEKWRLRYFLKSIRITSYLGLRILNVTVSLVGVRGEVSQRLIVANHLSYLDVLILFAHFPSLFVTSTDIRDTFLLGDICKLAGCFFVERKKEKRSLKGKEAELQEMLRKLSLGFNVFLFPEGTSSNGRSVLPFKGTFFQLAVDTKVKVLPLCLKYTGENRGVAPWYGDMTFPDHLFSLCLQKKIKVKLTILSEVEGDEKMKLARICHEKIAEAYA